jgi:hypothetical protein
MMSHLGHNRLRAQPMSEVPPTLVAKSRETPDAYVYVGFDGLWDILETPGSEVNEPS